MPWPTAGQHGAAPLKRPKRDEGGAKAAPAAPSAEGATLSGAGRADEAAASGVEGSGAAPTPTA